MTNAARRTTTGALLGAACALGGCLERRLHITSDPPGALVHLNDAEVGRTPCQVDFEFYGVYDVRLELEGFEPLMTSAEAKVPAHELPVVDLAALILPIKFTNDVRWHFALTPTDADTDALLGRARDLREQLDRPDPVTAQPEATSAHPPAEGQPAPSPED